MVFYKALGGGFVLLVACVVIVIAIYLSQRVSKSTEAWDTAMKETDYLLTTQFNIGHAYLAPSDCTQLTLAVYMRESLMDDLRSVLEEYHDAMTSHTSTTVSGDAGATSPSDMLDDIYDNMLLQIIGQPMSTTIEFNQVLTSNNLLASESATYADSDIKRVDTSRGSVQSIIDNMNDLANGGRPVAYIKLYYNGALQENTDFMVVGVLWHHDVLASYRDLQNLSITCSRKTKTCPELSQTDQLRAVMQSAMLQSQTTINLGTRVFEKQELKLLSSCLRNKMLQVLTMTSQDSDANQRMCFLADHLYGLQKSSTTQAKRSLHLGSSVFMNRACDKRAVSNSGDDMGGINNLMGMSDEGAATVSSLGLGARTPPTSPAPAPMQRDTRYSPAPFPTPTGPTPPTPPTPPSLLRPSLLIG